ncbi:MAG: DegT/DnrJ/EryC1/StrS family aminotransferase, partial [Thermoplasmata archaeon]|nr:DegT/DnrJ/EryC1/StrS family aminotransferase [Thermoplasmata archaeon]
GVIFTDDDDLTKFMRIFRNQGEDPEVKYLHPMVGQNYRMTDVHAAIGLAQFRRLETFLKDRRELAAAYTEAFVKVDGIKLQRIPAGAVPAWFFYPILVPRRDKVVEDLKRAQIETRVAWQYPIHEQPPYGGSAQPGEFPHADEVAAHVLNLPMFAGMTDAQRDHVIQSLKTAVQAQR